MKYSIIRDSREKVGQGWTFTPDDKIINTQIQALKEGDYTIASLEKKVIIERKGSLAEFAGNLVQDRFYRELDRLRDYPYSFIILEFNMYDLIQYPNTLKLPKYAKDKIKLTGKFLLKKVVEIEMQYPTKIIFAGNYGYDVAYSIFSNVWNFYDQ